MKSIFAKFREQMKQLLKIIIAPFARPIMRRLTAEMNIILENHSARIVERIDQSRSYLAFQAYDVAQSLLANQLALAARQKSPKAVFSTHAPVAHSSPPQKMFLLYTTENGELCFKLPDSKCQTKKRIFLSTLPKAGTYLCGRILSELGFEDTQIHAGDDGFTDYRAAKAMKNRFALTAASWCNCPMLHKPR
jgi:hypothetical protein